MAGIIGTSKPTETRLLVLDTDHVSALSFPSHASLDLLERIRASGQEAATTIITVEEQLRGWLAEIHRIGDPHRQVPAYERMQRRIDFFAAWTVLSWNKDGADSIACIVLTHDAILLTRNSIDFANVPRLRFENWLEQSE